MSTTSARRCSGIRSVEMSAPEFSETKRTGFSAHWVVAYLGTAWGDENLFELAAEIRSPLFLTHVRAGTGTPGQQTNCHPFRWRNWLFVHNGYVASEDATSLRMLYPENEPLSHFSD